MFTITYYHCSFTYLWVKSGYSLRFPEFLLVGTSKINPYTAKPQNMFLYLTITLDCPRLYHFRLKWNVLGESIIRKLNWIRNITKPKICYAVCSSSTKILHATVKHIPGLNKVVTEVQTQNSQIIFPTLDLNSVKVITYTCKLLQPLLRWNPYCYLENPQKSEWKYPQHTIKYLIFLHNGQEIILMWRFFEKNFDILYIWLWELLVFTML